MRLFIFSLFAAVMLLANNLSAQTESIDNIYIEDESIETPYRPKAKPHVFVRSKKGKSGVNRTPEADAAVKNTVTKIALVFTEITEEDAEEREDANYARWENLFKTYPEFFQNDKTEYVSICQCNADGDTAKFKEVQGFYIYLDGNVPVAKSEPVQQNEPEPVVTQKTEAPVKTASHEDDKPVKTQAVAAKTGEPAGERSSAEKVIAKSPEPPAKEEETKREPEIKESVTAATPETKNPATREAEPDKEEAAAPEETEEPVAAKPKPAAKKGVAGKPRKALDPKACRPACYGYGDEDLNIFFADNVKLSKKQKKKAKKAPVNLTLQLNPDGTIKKALVQGPNPELNQIVQAATQSMNPWNAAVKGGYAVKSQVKMTLKYDPESKALKPANVITNPRPTPKCKCVSDEEMFGSRD